MPYTSGRQITEPTGAQPVWCRLLVMLCTALALATVAVPPAIAASNDLWQALRDDMQFAHRFNHSVVDQEIKWLQRNPQYMARVSKRAAPYIGHILEQVDQRGLPAELALVPVIESAYDPFAYSPGRAAGLWQFIPATARHFELQQNWWYDGRRDVLAATDTALRYLEQLHQRFDDWGLALAAYNGGQARVARALRKNADRGMATDFWALDLPQETARYVPRLIAVARMIAEPKKYDIELYPVATGSAFAVVDVGSQIDLAQAASLAGIDMEQLYRLNPAYNRWATPPDGPHRIVVPRSAEPNLRAGLAELPADGRITWRRYRVEQGDTLSEIAQAHRSTVQQIAAVNELVRSRIRSGQYLLVPVASKGNDHYVLSADQRAAKLYRQYSKNSRTATEHVVSTGDSWWGIGKLYGVSHASLARWNGKAPGDLIRPGEKLVVWQSNGPASKSAGRSVTRKIAYRVRSGDNLSKIAARFSVTVSELVAWNNLDMANYLQPGDQLKIHVAVAARYH